MRRPAGILIAIALLVGTMAAFTYTEALKLEEKPIGNARFDRWFSPVCECPSAEARLSFALRQPERIDVTVVDADGEAVRVLGAGLRQPAGRVLLRWDGRDESGRIVPDGAYRVRVRLRDERRTIRIPVEVHVDTRAPRLRLRDVSTTVIGPGDDLRMRYRSNERATPVLLVDGEEALRGRPRAAGPRTVVWSDLVAELGLEPGIYSLALAVEDRAGNRSAPSEPTSMLVTAAPDAPR